jgi:prevent-host-death family protein
MQTVNIGELKNHLSKHLEAVKNGEEIVIREDSRPIAKIVPLPEGNYSDEELELIAEGILSPPKKRKLPASFWDEKLAEIELERVVRAVTDERDED